MKIIPMRDLKNTVEVERLCAEENGPVFVTKNGYGRLVVMDIDYYEKLLFCKWVVIIRLFTMFRAHCISISHSFWRQNCHFYKF